jgi:hypothetical protein
MGLGHHCDDCPGALKQACFEDKCHSQFCTVWMNKDGEWVRCGNRMRVNSAGCWRHLRKRGYNAALYKVLRNEIVDLAEFDVGNVDECDREKVHVSGVEAGGVGEDMKGGENEDGDWVSGYIKTKRANEERKAKAKVDKDAKTEAAKKRKKREPPVSTQDLLKRNWRWLRKGKVRVKEGKEDEAEVFWVKRYYGTGPQGYNAIVIEVDYDEELKLNENERWTTEKVRRMLREGKFRNSAG